jgi:hypothetical protein
MTGTPRPRPSAAVEAMAAQAGQAATARQAKRHKHGRIVSGLTVGTRTSMAHATSPQTRLP